MPADFILLVTRHRASLVRNSCEVVHQTLAPAQNRQHKSSACAGLGHSRGEKGHLCPVEITYLTLQILHLDRKEALI